MRPIYIKLRLEILNIESLAIYFPERTINECADQTVWVHRLVYAFVDRTQRGSYVPYSSGF